MAPQPHSESFHFTVERAEGTTLDDRIVRAVIGAVREKDRSGYEIWRWLGATHGSHGAELTEANLYPTLHRMEAQRLIRGQWSEGEGVRRLYRVASRGTILAQRRGWPPIARPIRPDPEVESVEAPGDEGSEKTDGGVDLADYLDRLDTALDLSNPTRVDVRSEIRDHLEDSAAELVREGMGRDTAVSEAAARLGTPELLGRAIRKEQLTRRRLLTGLGSAGVTALFGLTVGVAGGTVAVFLAPLVVHPAIALAGFLGLHLYLPDTVGWETQQRACAICVGIFLGARRSAPLAAQATGRSRASMGPLWALAGALPFLVIALLIPLKLDIAAALSLLLMPIAFALGVWKAQGPDDDLVSRRGIAGAALMLVVLLYPPGLRLWYFDPTTSVSAVPVVASDARLTWSSDEGGIFVNATGVDQSRWHDLRVELWPAVPHLMGIAPDDRATAPALVLYPGAQLDVNRLPAKPSDWWVALTATGPDGVRRTLASDVVAGRDAPDARNILSWLLAGP